MAGVISSLAKLLETNHRTTVAYHPQANGLVERLNHTLADMLSMYVNSNHTDLDCFVPYITFAYNTSVQRTTGRTPFYLVYGREARLPLEAMLGSSISPERKDNETILESLSRAREFVRQKIEIEQQDQKDQYDQDKREAEIYTIGDWVLVFKPI